MKHIIIILLFGILLFPTSSVQSAQNIYNLDCTKITSDPTLEGIEARITTALNNSFMKRDISYLDAIRAEIAGIKSAEYVRLSTYWVAYTDFNIAIYKLKNRETEATIKILASAIQSLEELSNKSSEELSLLSFLQDFYVQFVPVEERQALSLSATDNIDQALTLDSENMRAHYIKGRISYYDQGNKTVEASLKKAIELPANKTNSTVLPSWGKAEAYELLVQYYLREGNKSEAKATLDTALDLFPDNYQLSMLVSKVNSPGEE